MYTYSTPTKQLYESPKRGDNPLPSPLSPAVEKLYKVREGLNSLNGEIKSELDQKREAQEQQLQELRNIASKVEKRLSVETKKRYENDRMLQSVMKAKLQSFEETMEKKMNEKFDHLLTSYEILTKRTASLEKIISEEREHTRKIINDLKLGILSQLEDLKSIVEQERVARIEKETQILKKLTEEIYKLNEKLQYEKSRKDQTLTMLKEELQKNEIERSQAHEHFRQRVLEELNIMKQALKAETENREAAQEQIAITIDQIVSKIKESFKMFSNK